MHIRRLFIASLIAAGCVLPAAAQSVSRIQSESARIASGVWVGNMLYLSGQLPDTRGNTQDQAESTFLKIQSLLEAQGLEMGDVVMMRVYMTADPALDHKLDFAGMNAAFAKFFGTPEQPNKPARSTVQVAALVAPGALVEIEVQAARPAGQASSAADTAFTEQQAAAGKRAYAKSCGSCHMPDLSGSNEMPALAGDTFVSTWGARSTKDLFEYVSAAMPYGAPSLTTAEYEAIVAFLLQANGAVPGPVALRPSTSLPIARLVGGTARE